MIFRAFLLLAAAVMLAGCPKPDKKSKKAQGSDENKLKDQSGDTSFQAFVGRLQKAVDARDRTMLASMLAPDFGYRWDSGPGGETPFAYWDRHKLWGELSAIVRQRWTPHGQFMVSPPAFAQNPDGYGGYRAGLTTVNGGWRFAYFVPAPPATGPVEAPSGPQGDRPLPPLPE